MFMLMSTAEHVRARRAMALPLYAYVRRAVPAGSKTLQPPRPHVSHFFPRFEHACRTRPCPVSRAQRAVLAPVCSATRSSASADGVDQMLAAGKDLGEKETEVPDIDSVPRKPRDILCLLLFLVAWIGWLIVAMMAITDGCPDNCNDPRKLVYGFDSQACMCGKDCSQMVPPGPNNKGKYRLYIPDPRDTDLRICVETCPPGFAFNKSSAVSAGTYLCKDNICEEGLTATQKADNDKMFFQEREYGNGRCPTHRADIRALACLSLPPLKFKAGSACVRIPPSWSRLCSLQAP